MAYYQWKMGQMLPTSPDVSHGAALRGYARDTWNRFLLFVANGLPRDLYSTQLRVRLFRLAGLHLARSIVIAGPLSILQPRATRLISIGRKSYLAANIEIGGNAGVSIGEFAQIAPNVSFHTDTHTLQFAEGKSRPTIQLPIRVEDHVWIGTGAIILPGVTIGRGAVVAAGAVVTQDVPRMTLVGGVPARHLGDIPEMAEA